MKKVFLLFFISLFAFDIQAQAPEKIKFQAVGFFIFTFFSPTFCLYTNPISTEISKFIAVEGSVVIVFSHLRFFE